MSAIGMTPFSKKAFFNYYIPIHGLISYGALSARIMNPSLRPKLPYRDLANVFLVSSAMSTSINIYRRAYLRRVPPVRRGFYAVLGGTLFSLGSMMAWAFIKTAMPDDNDMLCTILGMISSGVFIKLGQFYLNECDAMIKLAKIEAA